MVRALGPLIFQAAAKDVRVNKQNAALYGMLDNSFRRPSPDEPRVNLGGDEWANEWPKNSAWDFVAHRFTKDGTWRRQIPVVTFPPVRDRTTPTGGKSFVDVSTHGRRSHPQRSPPR